MHFINLYFTVPTNAPFAATISTVWALYIYILHEMLLDVTWAQIHVNMETQTNIKYYTEGSRGNQPVPAEHEDRFTRYGLE